MNRPTVAGKLAFIIFGLLTIAGGLAAKAELGPYPGSVVVDGEVAYSIAQISSNGDRTYLAAVEYVDERTAMTYLAQTRIGSSNEPTVGDSRKVAYRPSDPAGGRVLEFQWLPWAMIGVGTFVTVLTLALLIRSAVQFAKTHEDSETGLPATPSDERGRMIERLHTEHPLASALSRKARSAPAPAKWYPDPDSPTSGRLRWWDGNQWTDHTHDA